MNEREGYPFTIQEWLLAYDRNEYVDDDALTQTMLDRAALFISQLQHQIVAVKAAREKAYDSSETVWSWWVVDELDAALTTPRPNPSPE